MWKPEISKAPGLLYTLSLDNITLAAGTTPNVSTVKLYSARPAPEARHTRNARNPLPEFCSSLNIGNSIIVRSANKEEGEKNPDEDYFVVRIEEGAPKLDEAGVYSTVLFRKNDLIVFVRWYMFPPFKAE